MSTSSLAHPGPEILRAFALGQLDTATAPDIERHVEGCAACGALLAQYKTGSDPFPQWLGRLGDPAPATGQARKEEGTLGAPKHLAFAVSSSGELQGEWTLGGLDDVKASTPPAGLLGRFEMLGELGRGGMGVVYKARDRQLKRLVAIKMMHQGTLDSDHLARFQAEAMAVARLKHPHIVQLLEVGEEDGKPYQVLEYLDGGTLARHCGRCAPDGIDAARIVRTLAEAIAHAHNQGIIHRDLKPANVLLTSDGVAKITDFGLVKFDRRLLKDTLPSKSTTTGYILGTPRYMSPEQTRGVPGTISPATDIYALGIILYELLSGHAPFDALANPLDMLRAVQEQEPPPLRRVCPDVPRDLEVICMKCLQREPQHRYTSAEELAAELGRFVVGEPILARPVSWRRRAGRWCRRNPAVAALLACLAVVIVVAFAGLSWLYVDADHERQRAQRNEEAALANAREADQQREEALGYFEVARAAVETFHTRVTTTAKLKERDLRPFRTAMLEAAVRFHEALIHRRTDDPRLQAEQGRAYRQLGDLRGEMGQYDAALDAYNRAIDRFTALRGNARLHKVCLMELSGTLQNRGTLLRNLNKPTEAMASYEAALPLMEQLARENPQDFNLRHNLLASQVNYSSALTNAGRHREAVALLTTNLGLMQELAAQAPTPKFQLALAIICHNIGVLFLENGQHEAALLPLRQARDIHRHLKSASASDPARRVALLNTLTGLGGVLNELKRTDEAKEVLAEGRALGEQLVQEHPSLVECRVTLGGVYCNLGNLHDDPASALPLYERAIRELQAVHEREPRLTSARDFLANSYMGRAGVLDTLKRYAEAIHDWEQANALTPQPRLRLCRVRSLILLRRLEEGTATLIQELPKNAHPELRFQAAAIWSLAAQVQTAAAEGYLHEALKLLKPLAAEGYLQRPAQRQMLQHHPDFAAVRGHAEFPRLMGGN